MAVVSRWERAGWPDQVASVIAKPTHTFQDSSRPLSSRPPGKQQDSQLTQSVASGHLLRIYAATTAVSRCVQLIAGVNHKAPRRKLYAYPDKPAGISPPLAVPSSCAKRHAIFCWRLLLACKTAFSRLPASRPKGCGPHIENAAAGDGWIAKGRLELLTAG